MEIIIGIIMALVGGLFFYKKKADKAAVDGKLAKTKGQDQELELKQEDLERMIAEIDDNIKALEVKKKADKNKRKNMTLAERRDAIRKGKKK